MSLGIRSGVNWTRREVELEGAGEGLRERGLGDAGDAFHQDVAAGQERGEQLLDGEVLAHHHLADLADSLEAGSLISCTP